MERRKQNSHLHQGQNNKTQIFELLEENKKCAASYFNSVLCHTCINLMDLNTNEIYVILSFVFGKYWKNLHAKDLCLVDKMFRKALTWLFGIENWVNTHMYSGCIFRLLICSLLILTVRFSAVAIL